MWPFLWWPYLQISTSACWFGSNGLVSMSSVKSQSPPVSGCEGCSTKKKKVVIIVLHYLQSGNFGNIIWPQDWSVRPIGTGVWSNHLHWVRELKRSTPAIWFISLQRHMVQIWSNVRGEGFRRHSHQWCEKYGRAVKTQIKPLLILWEWLEQKKNQLLHHLPHLHLLHTPAACWQYQTDKRWGLIPSTPTVASELRTTETWDGRKTVWCQQRIK